MKNSLLMLAGAAALSLASCSQEKTAETTVAAGGAGTTTTTTTTTTSAPMSEADIEARAQRLADRVVADMRVTDEATKTKIRTAYVNRYKKINEMRTQYASDTTGMAAAMRESMTTTDAEFKTIFVDHAVYQAYESNRTSYYDMENEAPASSDVNATATTTADANANSGDAMSGSAGGKVKVKADGDIKIKDAQGNKTKIAGDDGTIKTKPADGGKSVIK